MRIACLQFAPQVGDIDNNLNRADAVLAKASQDDIDSLDLLVLPELAFSGCKFGSYDEIAPFLEPSGSGISSLWARTIALKHNTNVLVGYPEKLDASGNSRAGPTHFNSTILVNGEGETVANYRKTFLHSVDETWAQEGEGFFGGRVPGLGRTAIGIGADVDPDEAPWHAFEFAFHILDVRANLAIVNMAWSTQEPCEQFTQFPNEPDMDTLAYWAQRLEPVIRDESREELIIVFCNRTGLESADAVYAGTSAVIGIYQGEVRVYGLLGRGVKELLVVDTDHPPFANLTMRKSRAHLSPLEYELSARGSLSGPQGVVRMEPSPVDASQRYPTRDPSTAPVQAKTGLRLLFEKALTTPLPDAALPEAVVASRPDFPSPSGSNSTIVAAGRQPPVQSGPTPEPEADGLVTMEHSPTEDGQILDGDSVEIVFDDDSDDHDDEDDEINTPDEGDSDAEDTVPTREFASPPPPPGHALPPGAQLNRFPDRLGLIAIQYPNDTETSNPQEAPLRNHDAWYDQSDGPPRPPLLPDGTCTESTRPSTATGARPSRPSSPKSRNVSRAGRSHIPSWPENSVLDKGDVVPAMSHRRTQSVTASRRDHDTNSSVPRSMSRPSRDVGLDQALIERALDFYLGSLSVDARDSRLFAASTRTARSESRPSNFPAASTRAGSTEPSSIRGPASSTGRRSSSSSAATSDSARSKPSTPPGVDRSRYDAWAADQSRPMLWKEDSQLVGQHHVRRSSSPDFDPVRGRRRSRSPASMGAVRRASAQARSPSRSHIALQQRARARSASAERIIPTSRYQSRHGDTIRTIRDPSLGPPQDPEDEIIAEITIRRPCPNCGSRSCGLKKVTAPKPAGALAEGDSAQKENSPRAPPAPAPAPSPADSEKPPTFNSYRAAAHQGLARLALLQTSAEELEDLRAPNLSRGSFRTLSSYEPSPVTPPPRRSEPRMPWKAMPVFAQDHSCSADLGSGIRFDAVDALSGREGLCE